MDMHKLHKEKFLFAAFFSVTLKQDCVVSANRTETHPIMRGEDTDRYCEMQVLDVRHGWGVCVRVGFEGGRQKSDGGMREGSTEDFLLKRDSPF